MATVFTHAFVGGSFVYFLNGKYRTPKNYLISALISAAPDLDVISFRLGIPYDSLFGHRGITHSLFSALILGLLAFLIAINFNPKNIKKTIFTLLPLFIVSALSHGILDAFTNGGHGVAFFAPLQETRYFFPVHPIEVCKIGINFFHAPQKLFTVLKSEFIYVWLPILMLMALIFMVRKKKALAIRHSKP